ncbi:hypothetical protein I317_07421 [Kwoniella heveanensis CBS 569]|nr:hypothetical protein I317_07421 [Kwoniella heveanensis CBS 569]
MSMKSPTLPFHLVNAFTPSKFGGNQAAVVLFDNGSEQDKRSTDEDWMRLVARDFNFSETAYLVPLEGAGGEGYYKDGEEEGNWGLRWFTPSEEVELCGHATLASASTLFTLYPSLQRIAFQTRWSGILISTRTKTSSGEAGIEIILPSFSPDVLAGLANGEFGQDRAEQVAGALGVDVEAVRDVSDIKFSGMPSIIVLLDSSVDVKGLKVDAKALGKISGGWFVTQIAPESEDANADAGETEKLYINSRVFGPGLGIDEDPVTGSAHAYFTGYYLNSPASKFLPSRFHTKQSDLGNVEIVGRQVSARGGLLRCKWDEGKVKIVGQAVEFARGSLSS